jgi:DNA-binding beta-propeller fold protein YncE
VNGVLIAAESKEPTVIPGDRAIIGVTSLGDRLFVLREPSEEQIEVYNSTTFTSQQTIEVPGLKDGYWFNGLTSSVADNCLFVSDCRQSTIYRIDLTNGNTVTQWPVVGGPTGLSMNSDNNLIVACPDDSKILEYTTNGKLVREIKLSQSNISDPTHSIQVAQDQFLLSHFGPVEGVSVIDATGQVLRSYRNDISTNIQFEWPIQLAVAKNGSFLVADRNKNRIVLINSSLSCARELSIDDALEEPRCLHLDESRGRLFVGEIGGRRVFVLDNVNIFFD